MAEYEEPKYEVLSKEGVIETRLYAPKLVAMVKVDGDRDAALSQGFRLLADFIFGNNSVQTKIAMTAPVEQNTQQKIAMTAPVEQNKVNGQWTVTFVMPSKYTIESIPKPNNSAVQLIEIGAEKYITIRFSGRNTERNVKKHERELIKYNLENSIKTVGEPKYAFYNAPFTLPFLRRNEVMFKLAENS